MDLSLARWSGGTRAFLRETFFQGVCVCVYGGESVLTGKITGSSGDIREKKRNKEQLGRQSFINENHTRKLASCCLSRSDSS